MVADYRAPDIHSFYLRAPLISNSTQDVKTVHALKDTALFMGSVTLTKLPRAFFFFLFLLPLADVRRPGSRSLFKNGSSAFNCSVMRMKQLRRLSAYGSKIRPAERRKLA